MKRLLVAGLALALSACAGMTPRPAAPGDGVLAPAPVGETPALLRAEAAYLRIRSAAERVLPWLPEPYASRAHRALAVADRAFGAARLATSVADQFRAEGGHLRR